MPASARPTSCWTEDPIHYGECGFPPFCLPGPDCRPEDEQKQQTDNTKHCQ
ncbi:hypothetical protein ABZY30_35275 [Streptomyces massasporeus]|uniref:hypothetical protein n=1 Tax=Streptomyces massasporeus TaxID=67324 RepID=UPI0033B5F2FD